MNRVGIEALNVFAGDACVDVAQLAQHRGLDMRRFANLLMNEKSVALPHEDAVTYAVNAAKPIVAAMSEADRRRIELVITCTESGVDFGKSLSTYVHQLLELERSCRLFEIKQACYSGTAGLQMAASFVLSNASPGAKALVIATDITRFAVAPGTDVRSQDWAYAEPSSAAGAVAMLVSADPLVFQLDVGASGYYGYEIMDSCRPEPDGEYGDADLSLLSYLDCCERSFAEYQRRVSGADYGSSFHYLAFHTPFGGLVKGAHRTLMRKLLNAESAGIESDFERRVAPGLTYCRRVGNIMGGTVLLSLAGTIDHGDLTSPRRIGCFAYGSGCCSEFFSGVVTTQSLERQRQQAIEAHLNSRYRLSMNDYDDVLRSNLAIRFGTRNLTLDDWPIDRTRLFGDGRPRLTLARIANFHHEYEWAA